MKSDIKGAKYEGPLPEETITVSSDSVEILVDVKALLSNYTCIYGKGCQGTAPFNGETNNNRNRKFSDRSVMGCCRTSPKFSDDSESNDTHERIIDAVHQLESQDCENVRTIHEDGWYYIKKDGSVTDVVTYRGNCVFLNSDQHSKPGCSLWHLAERKGWRPQDVRPQVCHTEPMITISCGTGYNDKPRFLLTLRPYWYGFFDRNDWYCTKSEEAYVGTLPVYQSMDEQIQWVIDNKELTDRVRNALDEIWQERKERVQKNRWGKPVFLAEPTWLIRKQNSAEIDSDESS